MAARCHSSAGTLPLPCQGFCDGALSQKSCTRLTDSIHAEIGCCSFSLSSATLRPAAPTTKPACNDVSVCYLRNLNLSRRQHRARQRNRSSAGGREEGEPQPSQWVSHFCCLLASVGLAARRLTRVYYVFKGCFWIMRLGSLCFVPLGLRRFYFGDNRRFL